VVPKGREWPNRVLDTDAEALGAYEHDLIAQLEHVLRCARDAMRMIETLRGTRQRVVPGLTEAQLQETFNALSQHWTDVRSEMTTALESCTELQRVLARMQGRLTASQPSRNSLRRSGRRRIDPAET
jgi:hypothetical protein